LPDEDRQLEMYERGMEFLIGEGYEHYEISNFSKNDRRCAHNQIYWRNEEYLGIGAGAYSYINGERRWNIKNPVEYIKAVKSDELRVKRKNPKSSKQIEGRERLSDKNIMGETIMMGLRMIDGINLQSFKKRFNTEIQSVFHTAVSKLLNNNLISFNNGYLRLSKKGLLFYNDVAAEFLI
jgi:oxygen-independent coproporphyrinogen-3 oxidase